MTRKLVLSLLLIGLCAIGQAHAKSIVWIAMNWNADGTGTVNDDWQPWIDGLTKAGYTVDVRAGNWDVLTAAKVADLETFDLVLFSRAIQSGTFATDAAEIALWNSVKKPMLLASPYVLRKGRWNWILDDTVMQGANSGDMGSPLMQVVAPTHPIFYGVTLDANNQVKVADPCLCSGQCSFQPFDLTTNFLGNGTVIAKTVPTLVPPTTSGGTAYQVKNYPWIVEWQKGDAYYAGTTNIAASHRMHFSAGTHETAVLGVNGGAANKASGYNLTAQGWTLFLNAVKYMIGDQINTAIAGSPYPADKATDAPAKAVMTWTAGTGVTAHDVYFGTDVTSVTNATRANPLGVLVATGTAATSYTPAKRFEYGKTYYWRVDEVGVSQKGDVWSFTAEPKSYAVTAAIKATASAQASTTEDPCMTVNSKGLTGDLHGTDNKTMWITPKGVNGGKLPQWIKYEFDRVYKFDQMWVWNYNISTEDESGIGAKDVTIEYSVDGSNWAALGNYQFADGTCLDTYAHNTEVGFKGVSAKFVRLTITSSWISTNQTGLSEVRFFYVPVLAREPIPATGSTNISPSTSLSWRPGREAVQHQIYLGNDANTLTPAGTTTSSSFSPTTLGVGGKYYWRVDEVNSAETPTLWAGDVWNFTTPNFLAVDDMESYTDLTGQAVFNIWKDGYNTTTNGGLIGYDPPAACMEKTIIHGGKQSTPFRYGQNVAPISEASLSFATAQDWTTAKADTLRVWVQGRTDNVPAAATIPASTTSFVISAGGTDIYQATDQFRFVYRTLTGDGSITAKIEAQQPTNQYAKAGVVMRVGLDAGAMEVHMITMPNTPNTTSTPKQVEWNYRPATADANAHTQAISPAIQPSTWVRITRKGNVFTGEYSADGVTWTSDSVTTTPQTIAMGSTLNVGLVVCSHVAGTLGMAMFSNVKITGSVGAADWQKTDIGWTFDATTAVNAADTFYVTVSDGSTSKTVVPTLPIPATSVGFWQAADIPFSQFTGVKMNAVKQLTIGVGDKSRSTSAGPGQIFIDDIGVGHP
jgi:hypothetical protein